MALPDPATPEALAGWLVNLTGDLDILADIIGGIGSQPASIPNPADGYAHPSGDRIRLAWWMLVHGVETTADERWPTGPQGPTPADHVWADNAGAWAWCPA